ncbi:MAG: glycosyltransferase [Thermodesulfobacteriota bacterium]
MDKTILIYGLPQVEYLPLIRNLADQGFKLIINATPLAQEAEAAGLSCRGWEEFISPKIQTQAQREVSRLSDRLFKSLEPEIALKAFSSPLGNFIPVTGQEFFQQLLPLLANEITIVETLDEILRHHDLRLILLGCDNDCNQRALVNYARLRGVPSLHLAHGLYSKPRVHIAGEVDRLYSDYITVFGARARDNMVASGNPPERIFLTGTPLWDPLYSPGARMAAQEARRRLGLDPDRPVVLFCSSYSEGSSAYFRYRSWRMHAIHEAVLEAIQQLGPQVQLLVRPHPNELRRALVSPEDFSWLVEAYQRWLTQKGMGPVQLSLGQKIPALRAADVVIVADQSSMIPEAMILERPTIMLTLLKDFATTYTEADGIVVAEEKTQLTEALEDLITYPAAREAMVNRQNAALPELNFGHDGRATERVTALALELAGREADAAPAPRKKSLKSADKSKSKLNLVIAAHGFLSYNRAGTEIYTHDLARAMQRRGHQVRVMYPIPVNFAHDDCFLVEGHYEGLPVVEILSSPLVHFLLRHEALKPVLRQYFLDHPADLVHIQHLMGLTVSFLEVLQELEIPVVLTANDYWVLCKQVHLVSPAGKVCEGPETIDKCVDCVCRHQGNIPEEQLPQLYYNLADWRLTQRRAMRLPELVLCPSRFLLEVYQRYDFVNERMIHAPQGANLFTPAARPERDVPPIIFSYLGGIYYRKGLDLLVEAFNQVDTARAELHVHGDIAAPDYFNEVMQSVLPGKKVTYHGGYSPADLPGILARTDVAVVPSRGENYPFVIREILHARVPVVAANIAGIPEIVLDRQNGLLFKENDPQDLAAKLARFIDRPELIEELRAGIQPMKSMDQDAADIEPYYRDILARRAQGSRPVTSARSGPGQGLTTKELEASIIIPVFNNFPLTRQCLESIRQYTSGDNYEVIVVDNGSRDETPEFLFQEVKAGRVRALFNQQNNGFAKACNQGARAARGRNLVFLNNDTVVTPGWLAELLAGGRQAEDIGIVGAKLLYPDDTVQHAGVVFTQLKNVAHIYKNFDKDHPAVNKVREYQAVTAACLLIKKDLFFQAGLFDERYLNGIEDLDLCFKIRRMGYRVIYHPRSVVYHLEAQTPGRGAKEEQNSRLFVSQWHDTVIPDDFKYYQEDGLHKETVITPDGERSYLIYDSNENIFLTEGLQLREQGNFNKALECLQRALKFNPYDPRNLEIAEELADLHEVVGNYGDAARYYQMLAEKQPSPHYYFKLGILYKKLENFPEAIENLEKAKELLTGLGDSAAINHAVAN